MFIAEQWVYRSVTAAGAPDYESARDAHLLAQLVNDGLLLECTEADPAALVGLSENTVHVLRHPKIPYISYPYEWTFSALKDAALLHLDLQMQCLHRGFNLSDASAYNIQFMSGRPIFIDVLSIRPYRDGEIWTAHRQFCEQFLNPLLLQALCGVEPNAWYRGNLEGIPVEGLARLLPLRRKLSWNVLKHVVLQATFQGSSATTPTGLEPAQIRLPLAALQSLLGGLRSWIAKLEPRSAKHTVWSGYAEKNTYSSDEARLKGEFVAHFCAAERPGLLWDMGCNTGDYAVTALEAGARQVVGVDADIGAVEQAYHRAKCGRLDFLPLHMAVTNPSPSQGWAETERGSMSARARADALLALALVHHLAIAGNVPLGLVVDWLVSLAPKGVVEFVPKADPMVAHLLRLREDIFDDYSLANFESRLSARATIVKTQVVSDSGRTLYWFERL